MTPITDCPTIPGTPFAGGFYAGRMMIGSALHAVIVAPKAQGESQGIWIDKYQDVPGAQSCFDGHANTTALSEAGSPIAKWAQALDIAGHADWHIPSRDALELTYRNLKPTTSSNYASFRDGDNPSSLPAGYPYTEESPAQTADPLFQTGGAEAFDATWYWASTQYSTDYAWCQYFTTGYQDNLDKSYKFKVRAVRTIQLTT